MRDKFNPRREKSTNWGNKGEAGKHAAHTSEAFVGLGPAIVGQVSGQRPAADAHNGLAGVREPYNAHHRNRHDLSENGEAEEQERDCSADDCRFNQVQQTHISSIISDQNDPPHILCQNGDYLQALLPNWDTISIAQVPPFIQVANM
jgi:hypothetical protein